MEMCLQTLNRFASLVEQPEDVREPHCEPVVGEGAKPSYFILLVELSLLGDLLLGGDDVLHVVDRQRRHDRVEPP